MENLGDRMKNYEFAETGRIFMPKLPVIARMDGRSFSKFTRRMRKPYDPILADLMLKTCKYMVEETNANVGYTQSDEISLVWYVTNPKSQIFFNGRIQKMVSQLASLTTLKFYQLFRASSLYAEDSPTFDARVWQVPDLLEAYNCLLWREQDATKNSISIAAQQYYSEKQLHGKNGSEKQEMLFQKGINWNDYPTHFKRGRYFKRKTVAMKYSPDEIQRLPAKHEAWKNPDLTVERSVVEILDIPIISQVENPTQLLFE